MAAFLCFGYSILISDMICWNTWGVLKLQSSNFDLVMYSTRALKASKLGTAEYM